MGFNEIVILKNKPSFQRCMEIYEKPKCTHSIILHLFHMIKSLPKVSILYPFGPLMNFQIYTWNSLPFKSISHLTMVCYHQNLIRRIIGLTIFPFFMMINLGYLGEEKNLPLKPIMDQSIKIYQFKTKIIKTCEFSIGNSVSHENI